MISDYAVTLMKSYDFLIGTGSNSPLVERERSFVPLELPAFGAELQLSSPPAVSPISNDKNVTKLLVTLLQVVIILERFCWIDI